MFGCRSLPTVETHSQPSTTTTSAPALSEDRPTDISMALVAILVCLALGHKLWRMAKGH